MDVDECVFRHVRVLVTVDVHGDGEEVGLSPRRAETTRFQTLPPVFPWSAKAIEELPGASHLPLEICLSTDLVGKEMNLNHQLPNRQILPLSKGKVPAQAIHGLELGKLNVHLEDITTTPLALLSVQPSQHKSSYM